MKRMRAIVAVALVLQAIPLLAQTEENSPYRRARLKVPERKEIAEESPTGRARLKEPRRRVHKEEESGRARLKETRETRETSRAGVALQLFGGLGIVSSPHYLKDFSSKESSQSPLIGMRFGLWKKYFGAAFEFNNFSVTDKALVYSYYSWDERLYQWREEVKNSVNLIALPLFLNYSGRRIEPYLGIGPAVVLGKVSDITSIYVDGQKYFEWRLEDSYTKIGFQSSLGMNLVLLQEERIKVAPFLEFKLSYLPSPIEGLDSKVVGHIAFGVSAGF